MRSEFADNGFSNDCGVSQARSLLRRPSRSVLTAALVCTLAGALVCMMGQPVRACTPIPYLFELFAGSTPWGIMFAARNQGEIEKQFSGSSVQKVIPVVTGLITNPVLLLLLVTAGFKSVFIKKKLSPHKSLAAIVFYVIVANFISSVPPIGFMVVFAVPMLALFFCVIAVFFMGSPARLLAGVYFKGRRIAAFLVRIALGFSFLVTIVLLKIAESNLMAENLGTYWGFKIAFCIIAVGSGLVITTAIESMVLHRYLGRTGEDGAVFYSGLLTCNALAVATVLGIAALAALPLRFASPDFLI